MQEQTAVYKKPEIKFQKNQRSKTLETKFISKLKINEKQFTSCLYVLLQQVH